MTLLSAANFPMPGTLPAAAVPDDACIRNVLSLQELGAAGISVAAIDHAGDKNPVDKIWGEARPAPPKSPVRIHKMAYAGETVKDKLAKVDVFWGTQRRLEVARDATSEQATTCRGERDQH